MPFPVSPGLEQGLGLPRGNSAGSTGFGFVDWEDTWYGRRILLIGKTRGTGIGIVCSGKRVVQSYLRIAKNIFKLRGEAHGCEREPKADGYKEPGRARVPLVPVAEAGTEAALAAGGQGSSLNPGYAEE